MSFGIGVNLPTVTSFLMLYSLSLGSVIICYWTMFRSIYTLIFLVMASLEVFSPGNAPFGGILSNKPIPPNEGGYHVALFSYLVLIVTEAFLILFTIEFAIGLYHDNLARIQRYLLCRFVAWLMEVMFLALASVTHYGLIGWYLLTLIVIILEFYGFIVVFSYYKDLQFDEMSRKYPEYRPPLEPEREY